MRTVAALTIVSSVITSCSIVTSSSPRSDAALPYPKAFYVEDFSIDLARAVQDSEVSTRAEYIGSLTDISRRLSAKLRSELMDIAPVYILKPDDPRPKEGYIIQGDFLAMDAGSPAARSFMGFGFGQTKLLANVRMYLAGRTKAPARPRNSKNILEERDYQSDGIRGDGLVMGINVRTGSGLVMGVPGAYHRLDDDADAAAREIARKIRKLFGYPLK